MDYLTQEQIDILTEQMHEQRSRIRRAARQAITNRMEAQDEVPADTIDVSTEESNQATELRLRDREKFLLAKIEKALGRMEEGIYGYCKECDGEIGFPRLKARPVAEMCIECKEEQEHHEKRTPEKRARQSPTIFK